MDFHVSLIGVVGALTIFFGILVMVIGIPKQIRHNFLRKSTVGISLANQSVALLAYFFWTFFGFLRHDRFLLFGQSLGVITTSIILYQFALHRRKRVH